MKDEKRGSEKVWTRQRKRNIIIKRIRRRRKWRRKNNEQEQKEGVIKNKCEGWERRRGGRKTRGGQVVNFRVGISEAAEPPGSAGHQQDFHTEIDSLTLGHIQKEEEVEVSGGLSCCLQPVKLTALA